MVSRFFDEALRRRLRALQPPTPSQALHARVLAGAPPLSRRRGQRRWLQGLALAASLVLAVYGVLAYQDWQEAEELAQLDTLSAASLLLL